MQRNASQPNSSKIPTNNKDKRQCTAVVSVLTKLYLVLTTNRCLLAKWLISSRLFYFIHFQYLVNWNLINQKYFINIRNKISTRIDLIFVPHPFKCIFKCLFQTLFLKVASTWYNSYFFENILPSPVRFWHSKLHISHENASSILALLHTSGAVLLGKQTDVAIDVVTPWRFRFRF